MTQPLPRLTEPEQFERQLEQNAQTDMAAGRAAQATWQEQAVMARGALEFAVLAGRKDWVQALAQIRFECEARARAAANAAGVRATG
jgi:hypothetical protein